MGNIYYHIFSKKAFSLDSQSRNTLQSRNQIKKIITNKIFYKNLEIM